MPRASIKSYRPTGSQAANRRKLYANYAASKSLRRAGYTTVPRTMGVYAQGEMKYFDTERTATSVSNAGTWNTSMLDPATVNTLFAPAVGSAINQRIGREVKVHKIKIRGAVQVTAQSGESTADAATQLRLILVQDTQTNAAQMTGNLLMTNAPSAASIGSVNSFQSLANVGRFRVLKDKQFVMMNPNMANDTQATGGLVQQGLIKTFKMTYTPKVPISVRFNATNGGTIADIVDNSFHVMGLAATGADLAPSLAYICRVSYKE